MSMIEERLAELERALQVAMIEIAKSVMVSWTDKNGEQHYFEFGVETLLKLIAEVRRLKKRLRTTAQIIIEEVGADGPTNSEDAAIKIVTEVRRLREDNAAKEMLLKEAVVGAEEVNAELAELRSRVEKAEQERDKTQKKLKEVQNWAKTPDWVMHPNYRGTSEYNFRQKHLKNQCLEILESEGE